MSDAPQEELIPVRYTDGQPRIINGETVSAGDIVYLPADEVATWPSDAPHPYYERAEPSDAAASAASSSPPSRQEQE